MVGRVRFPLALALAVGTLSAAFGVGAAAPLDQALKGDIDFLRPLEVTGTFGLPRSWKVQWWDAGTTPTGDLQEFDLFGPRVKVTYTQRVNAPYSTLPAIETRDLTSEVRYFDAFHVELEPRLGPRELEVRGGGQGEGDLAGTSWTMTTLGPGEVLEPPSLTRAPNLVGRWQMLVESDRAVLRTPEARHVHVYGFTVRIHHSEGVTSYTTGALDPQPLDSAAGTPLREGLLVLEPTAAQLRLGDGDTRLRLVAPAIPVHGVVLGPVHHARIVVAGASRNLDHAQLDLAGAFVFHPEEPQAVTTRSISFEGLGSLDVPGSLAGDVTSHQGGLWLLPLAGAGIVTVGLLLVFRDVLAHGLVGLFARLTRNDMDRSPVRRRLLEAIRAEPGIALEEAAEAARCAWGTVIYHTAVLQKLGYVASYRSGRRRCLFDAQAVPAGDRPARALLRLAKVRRLLDLLASPGPWSQSQLAERVGLTQPQVSRWLARMAGLGIVERRVDVGAALTARGRGLVRALV